VICRFNHNIC